jgi:hypothetical protein
MAQHWVDGELRATEEVLVKLRRFSSDSDDRVRRLSVVLGDLTNGGYTRDPVAERLRERRNRRMLEAVTVTR